MGYLKSTGTVLIYIGLFLTLVAFLPGIPPDTQFSEYSILRPIGLTGDLGRNKRLDNAEILLKGELKGPESFASYNGELYTSLHGGDVVKIVGKHVVPIVKFGKPCDGWWMEKECGRPLGLQFDKNGALYVSDAYYGIFKVDVTSGKYERIVDISKPIEGAVPKLANSLDIASNGDIYWSDSSSEHLLQDGVYTVLSNPSGRLIKYDAATKRNVVLVGNLHFANGVKLSKDESFVVVAETFASRLTKFNLKGSKAGRAEPFVQGLPGLPDNLDRDGDDGFLVGLIVTADEDHPVIAHSLAPHPHIRRMLSRLLYLLEAPFKLIEDVYPNYYSKRATHWIGHFESIGSLHPAGVTILRIDASGKIIDASHSVDGKISGISSGYIFKDHLYLGSPYNEYLARVPLKQAFPSIKPAAKNIVREKVVEKREVKEPAKPAAESKPAPKPTTTPSPPTTTTTPKPVTTTPKPATTTPKPSQAPPKPATAAPTTTQPPQQQRRQQQQTAPKPTKSAEPVRQVPVSTPPPPAKKAPVKETVPAQQAGGKTGQQASPPPPSKPASPKKPTEQPSNAQKSPPPQKPAKPVEVKNVKETEAKKTEQTKQTVKPLVATPAPPRN